MSVYRLFLYNVPQDKNEYDLAGEFRHIDLSFHDCTLHNQMAIVSFETQEDMNSFCTHFQQLRDNTFIYECLV